jgi:Holliday junction resolvasome RuvABC endonuclease subunit
MISKILGIDQSINSTGICLYTSVYDDCNILREENYEYWIIASKLTKKQEAFQHPRIHILHYDKQTGSDYETKEIAKTNNIYNICDIIHDIITEYKPDRLCMEGISYGSTGGASVIDLAGLNYCIRATALTTGTGFRIASPMSLKKFATGNGGASKEEMVWAWKQCDRNISDISDIKIDDLADAFFLAKYGKN